MFFQEYVPDDPGSPESLSTNGFRSDSDSNPSPYRAKIERRSVIVNGRLVFLICRKFISF